MAMRANTKWPYSTTMRQMAGNSWAVSLLWMMASLASVIAAYMSLSRAMRRSVSLRSVMSWPVPR